MNATTRTAVERAMMALANAETALSLATAGVQAKLSVALGQLSAAREAFDERERDVRLEIIEQAKSDAGIAARDDEAGRDAVEWFQSWLDDEDEHVFQPLTLSEARSIYSEAFKRALESEAAHG
jgi:hypothetical protein